MRTMNAILALVTVSFALWITTASRAEAFVIDTMPYAYSNVNGLWWNPSESGWGMTLTQEGNVVFATVFTYDSARNPTWYVVSNCPVVGSGCTGDLYQVFGGAPPSEPWNGSVILSKVGSLSLTFFDNNNGTASFLLNGRSNVKSITRQLFGQQPVTTNDSLAKTQMLIGGTWTYVYTIISTFNDRYTFTSTDGPNAQGVYYAHGTDVYGNPVIGAYYKSSNSWSVLDPSIIIDLFYDFTFSDTNHVSGCYYQISPPGSTNLGRCYSMNGFRSPPKSTVAQSQSDRYLRDQKQLSETATVPGDSPPRLGDLERYLELRRRSMH